MRLTLTDIFNKVSKLCASIILGLALLTSQAVLAQDISESLQNSDVNSDVVPAQTPAADAATDDAPPSTEANNFNQTESVSEPAPSATENNLVATDNTPQVNVPAETPAATSDTSSFSENKNEVASEFATSSSTTSAMDENTQASQQGPASSSSSSVASSSPISASEINPAPERDETISLSKFILDAEVKPNSSVRLTWNSDAAVGAFSEATPVLVVNGATPGKTLCLVAAVHGDELNGIEMIRRVIFNIDASKLTGTIIGVPVANIMGFRRNSRYLPDRRDWNRYFPGNTRGSAASRLAHSFFSKVIMHCDSLVDLHTGSFHRTNLPQLRADLSDENVAQLAQSFGAIAVLNGRGHPNSLRAAAVRAGIPAITLEAGEPMAMQNEVVEEGVKAINTLLAKMGMYGKQQRWTRIAPVYYRSAWVRANQSGILFSKATLGQRVKEDDVLGTVTDPITNARTTIKSPYNGRIIGMALDQVVLPGFAAYHIGIQTPEAILIEESQMQMNGEINSIEEDEEDGDDSGIVNPLGPAKEPATIQTPNGE
jgi:predicted deacylase